MPSIIINVNNLDPKKKNSYIPIHDEQLIFLIKQRVKELINKHYEIQEEYIKLKRYDSILIDGARGSGKSTVLQNIHKIKKLKKQKIFVLPIIDPNQHSNDAKIVDLIIENIFDEILKKKTNDLIKFEEICNLKKQLDDIMSNLYKTEIDFESISEKINWKRKEKDLECKIHMFIYKCCEFLNHKMFIQPIDDIDMHIEFAQNIMEGIRKYFQSPRIIPVIALDSNQLYSVIKQEYFSKFGFDAKTPLVDITDEAELDFLKKLPSEYIQKILPPSQMISLYDMYEYYDYYYLQDNNDELSLKFKFTVNDKKIVLSFKDVLKLLLNIVYEYYDKDENYDDIYIIDYLKNKTFRSFLSDVKSLFKGFEFKEDNIFTLNRKYLKHRFRHYSHTYNNKYDAVKWFWNSFVNKLENRIKKEKELGKTQIHRSDFVERILFISHRDSDTLKRKIKTYNRLYLQDFYIRDINIIFNEDFTKLKEINKSIDITGYMEFALRTIFPASFFNVLWEENLIETSKLPIYKFKEFANADIMMVLKLYENWLFFLGNNTKENKKENAWKKNCNYKNKYKFLSLNVKYNVEDGSREYYWQPFSTLMFLSMLNKNNFLNNFSEYIDKKVSPFEKKEKFLLDNNYSIAENCKSVLSFINSKVGINSLTKDIIFYMKNFIMGMRLLKQNNIIYTNMEEYVKYDYEKCQLYEMIVFKNISSLKAIFLNMFLVNILKDADKLKILKESETSIDNRFIFSGLNIENSIFPSIKNDPFITNLKNLEKIKDRYPNIYERFLNFSKFLNLDKIYTNLYDGDIQRCNYENYLKKFLEKDYAEIYIKIIVRFIINNDLQKYFDKNNEEVWKNFSTDLKKSCKEIKKQDKKECFVNDGKCFKDGKVEKYINEIQCKNDIIDLLKELYNKKNEVETAIEKNLIIFFISIIILNSEFFMSDKFQNIFISIKDKKGL